MRRCSSATACAASASWRSSANRALSESSSTFSRRLRMTQPIQNTVAARMMLSSDTKVLVRWSPPMKAADCITTVTGTQMTALVMSALASGR